jgi:hypothetical protein
MSDYPKIIDGRTVWACCESSIGPVCEHRTIGRRVTPDTLNEIMEFDHVIRVHADGTVTAEEGTYAPELHTSDDGEIYVFEEGWTLLTGYSGQDRYSGPGMHPSEYIGGRMATDILSTPGVYVAVYSIEDDDDPGVWAVAKRDEIETPDDDETPHVGHFSRLGGTWFCDTLVGL